ncbi:hypothetical protein ACHAXT_005410 [Thalassiosira profunda]
MAGQRAASPAASPFEEAFCAELPSQCSVYLSGKRADPPRHEHPSPSGSTGRSAPLLRFATERHSVALLQREAAGRRGGEGYSLSVARMPSSLAAADGEDAKKPATGEEDDDDDVCLAHSSISWDGESSVEIFAMTRTPLDEPDTREIKTCDASLTTHESRSVSEGGKEGGETTEQQQKPAEATEAGTSDGAPPNYYLRVKSRMLSDLDRTRSATVETIPLDFRPMSVHVAELYISTGTKEVEDTQQRCSAIGIFVASVDDNKLRLFVATKDVLQRRSEDKTAGDAKPCFVTVPLYDASTSSEDSEDADGNPLLFSSPIMAIETCVTSEEDLPLNHLAIACYDGTVQIMAYRLQAQFANGNEEVSRLQFAHVRCSTFVVDGPVASLHFGTMDTSEAPQSQTSSLFLVAGSFCGFACLFYELTMPPSGDNQDGISTFDGPLTIVDGLYDARHEGHEDCVTAVHACCGDRHAPLIAVGTQGGRVLLFRQCQQERISEQDREEALLKAQQEKEKLAKQISQKEEEMSRLETEREEMTAKTGEYRRAISDTQSKIAVLEKASPQAETESLELSTEAKGDLTDSVAATTDKSADGAMPTNSETADGDAANVVDEEKAEANASPTLDEMRDKEETAGQQENKESDTTTGEASPLQSELESARTQMLSLKEKIGDKTSQIAKLRSDADALIKQSIRIGTVTGDGPMNTRRVLRKMHRYEFLSEHHLPYPIHGIAHVDGGGEREILVSTRQSFHILQESPLESTNEVTA